MSGTDRYTSACCALFENNPDFADKLINTLSSQARNRLSYIPMKITLAFQYDVLLPNKINGSCSIRRQKNSKICRACPISRPRNANAFDGILRFTQTRRIQLSDCQAVQIHTHLNDITRRARMLRRDGRITAGQSVKQRRFPDIGRTNNRHLEAIPDTLCDTYTRDLNRKVVTDLVNQGQDV